MSVVGTRPQFVKLAAIARAVRGTDHEHIVVHTGQHYDPRMSDAFFEGLSIPTPDFNLQVGSASHGRQTGAILAAMDEVLETVPPCDWVLVYGDTNSTIAAALSAVKQGVSVAHLEAGLRSFNRQMPEEHNRVLTDHCADLLLAPTETAAQHLASEGLAERTVVVGDVMTDVLYWVREAVHGEHGGPASVDRPILATIHRAENTDNADRLSEIIGALANINHPVRLLAHPRLRARAEQFGISLEQGSILVEEPLPYREMVIALTTAAGVVTDSGGLQKEAYLMSVPCTTVRTETEWPETLVDGWNVIAPNAREVAAQATRQAPFEPTRQPYGDGNTATRVLQILAGEAS